MPPLTYTGGAIVDPAMETPQPSTCAVSRLSVGWPGVCAITAALLFATGPSVWGQASSRPCPPVGERTGEPAPTCVVATQVIGRLQGKPVYWHLHTCRTRGAADAAGGPRGTVVESLGKVWLFTIAEEEWRPATGERVAAIGPLPVDPSTEYTAVYMEAVFDPGTTAAIHSHSGPEAFYTMTGESCLETPNGRVTQRSDQQGIVVRGGPAMLLTAVGTVRRRAIALILHDLSRPATTMVHDWTPKGLCKS